MTLTPTAEQEAILAAYAGGGRLVIEAAAGSGKTSTLRMLAESARRGGLYLAYNKAIQVDAERSFPVTTLCRTAHSLAYAEVGYKLAHKFKISRQRARDVAALLGIRERLLLTNEVGERTALRPVELARLVKDTLTRFSHSADNALVRRHVPLIPGIGPEFRDEIADAVLPHARKGWFDLCNPRGRLRLDHDHYLKMWQLGKPRLQYEVIYLDEAQDANPVISDVVTRQDAQLVLVGDRNQQLYAWRGAVDAMSEFRADQRLTLTKSFRFGPAIADEANLWLEELDADIRVIGHDPVRSVVGPSAAYDAMLCRTNSGAIAGVLRAAESGRSAALVGGGREVAAMARAALDLQEGRPVSHPELMAFSAWHEVQEYVQSESDGSDLATFVRLIDTYGAHEVLDIIAGLVPEDRADVVISTGHKAKGREWSSVRIADDFGPPTKRDPESGERVETERARAELMLAYVAVTRARIQLDPRGLRPGEPFSAPAVAR